MSWTVKGLTHEEYLGDAVYAGWDGYHVVLYTSNGEVHNTPIYLDAAVRNALVHYFKRLYAEEPTA